MQPSLGFTENPKMMRQKKSSEQQFSGLSFSGLRQQLLKKPVVTTEVCTSHNMLNPEPDGLQAAEDYTSFCIK